MTSPDKTSPDFYFDWICRVHEEAIANSGRQLTPAAKDAIRHIWQPHALQAARRPAIFRLANAHYSFVFTEVGKMIAKTAELAGATEIGPEHVKRGTLACSHLPTGRQDQDLLACIPHVCDLFDDDDPALRAAQLNLDGDKPRPT